MKLGKANEERIATEETQSGCLTALTAATGGTLCNIQFVENSAMFQSSLHQQPRYKTPDTGYLNMGSGMVTSCPVVPLLSPSLDALTTLATVASSKHAEEMVKRANLEKTRTQFEGHNMETFPIAGGNRQTNSLHFSHFTRDGMCNNEFQPLKKRRRMTENMAVANVSSAGGINTRSSAIRQRDQ